MNDPMTLSDGRWLTSQPLPAPAMMFRPGLRRVAAAVAAALALAMFMLAGGCAYHHTQRTAADGVQSSTTSLSVFDDSTLEIHKDGQGKFDMKRGDTVSAQLGAAVDSAVRAGVTAALKSAIPLASSGADGAPPSVDPALLIQALRELLKQPAPVPPVPVPTPPVAPPAAPVVPVPANPKPVGP